MKNCWYYDYPFCRVGIAEEDGAICKVFFDKGKSAARDGCKTRVTPLIQKAAWQLAEYFNGKRRTFTFQIAPHGTAFQIKVWEALQKIPYGETRSYGEIASMIGNPKACRAVGMANNRNPVAIIIPCHRVIGHDGSLTGYGGGIELKRQLLDLEKTTLTMLRGKQYQG
jgi:methylated-DNA-[protein]-cysteine S-methyltransferase